MSFCTAKVWFKQLGWIVVWFIVNPTFVCFCVFVTVSLQVVARMAPQSSHSVYGRPHTLARPHPPRMGTEMQTMMDLMHDGDDDDHHHACGGVVPG